MRTTLSLLMILTLCTSLSGCWLLLGTAVGAAGGYMYKKELDKGDTRSKGPDTQTENSGQ